MFKASAKIVGIIAELRRKANYVDWYRGKRSEYYGIVAKKIGVKFWELHVLKERLDVRQEKRRM